MIQASLIIPTFNRADLLSTLLHRLNSQQYPHKYLEVIICSDGSTDNTKEIVAEFKSNFFLTFLNTQNTLIYPKKI